MREGIRQIFWKGSDLRSYSVVTRLSEKLGPIQISLLEFSTPKATPTECFEIECKDLYPEEIQKMKQLNQLSGIKASLRYRAGRNAARSALQCLGVKPCPILHDSYGAPIFPANISGSISHKNDIAFSGVVKISDFCPSSVTIGVDVEQFGGGSERLGQRILTGSSSFIK
jgi:4'-phosphopantetheinyl transferase EntD